MRGFDEGVDVLDLTDRGESVACLAVWVLDSGRRAYGSAVAGRLNSGLRGFKAGLMGAEDMDERGAPVGTVRTAGRGAGSDDWLSVNAD